MGAELSRAVLPKGLANVAVARRERTNAELHTDLEASEQSVAEHVVDLAAAVGELEGFAYSVSHDLRAPLRAIDGFSRILLEDYADKLDPEGQRVLNVVRDSTLKMGQLIDDILAFSRTARVIITPEPVDMAALVRRTLAELAPGVAGRERVVDVGVLPDTHGDRAMLQRVWMNLLDNAIKFTASKPDARIEIGASAGDGETIYYVRDAGAGFDMQYADKLFGVFQRLHGAEFPGTGIGLAIVKRIVTRHGGRVWAEGKVGDGATFFFTLPTQGAGW
jgi:two-component system sensor kinase